MAVIAICDECKGNDAFRVEVRVANDSTDKRSPVVPKFNGDLCAKCWERVAAIINAALPAEKKT